jgi:hypothetical protein
VDYIPVRHIMTHVMLLFHNTVNPKSRVERYYSVLTNDHSRPTIVQQNRRNAGLWCRLHKASKCCHTDLTTTYIREHNSALDSTDETKTIPMPISSDHPATDSNRTNPQEDASEDPLEFMDKTVSQLPIPVPEWASVKEDILKYRTPYVDENLQPMTELKPDIHNCSTCNTILNEEVHIQYIYRIYSIYIRYFIYMSHIYRLYI